jgi:hypothetical protein
LAIEEQLAARSCSSEFDPPSSAKGKGKEPVLLLAMLPFNLSAFSDPLPPDLTYRPLPTLPFSRVKAADEA